MMTYFLEDPNSNLIDKLKVKSYQKIKALRHLLRPNPEDQKIVLIVGCQRSGTTLLQRLFEMDFQVKVFGEVSELSSGDPNEKIRLNPLDQVRETVMREKAPIVVLKPLVETQNLPRLLDALPGSKALFIYRNYKDVVASNLNRFGAKNGIRNLRPIVENDQENWRAEKVPKKVRDLVLTYYSDDMNPYDAAALFWFVRNSFFLNLQLMGEERVKMVKYEDLVQRSEAVQQSIYEFIGRQYKETRLGTEVSSNSVGKGEEVKLTSEVEHLCQQMLEDLDQCFYGKATSAPGEEQDC